MILRSPQSSDKHRCVSPQGTSYRVNMITHTGIRERWRYPVSFVSSTFIPRNKRVDLRQSAKHITGSFLAPYREHSPSSAEYIYCIAVFLAVNNAPSCSPMNTRPSLQSIDGVGYRETESTLVAFPTLDATKNRTHS